MQHGGIVYGIFMRKDGRKKWERNRLKWYRLEEGFGKERYVKEFGSKGEVRLKFRPRKVSAGLLGDKEGVIWVRVLNVSYVVLWKICISCCSGEFAGDRGRLLGMIDGIEGTREWVAEWRNKGDEGISS